MMKPATLDLEELLQIRWWAALAHGLHVESHWTEITIGQPLIEWLNVGADWHVDCVHLRKKRDMPTDRLVIIDDAPREGVRIPCNVTATVRVFWEEPL